MNLIQTELLKQLDQLNNIEKEAQHFLKHVPEGSLRVSRCKDTDQYYWFRENSRPRGDYIKKEERPLIQALAQKHYAKNVLKQIQKDRPILEKALGICDYQSMNSIYSALSASRKKIIDPYILPDLDFINQWYDSLKKNLNKEVLNSEIYTERGEQVRSKSEKILADKFYMMDIPYLYEVMLPLNDYYPIKPDFTLLNIHTRQTFYWEHFGLMDDPEYCEKAIRKIESLQNNSIFPGKNLILTYETNNHPLNTKTVEQLVETYLL